MKATLYFLVIALSVLGLSIADATAPALPTILLATNNPYDAGFQAGSVFKDRIQTLVNSFKDTLDAAIEFTNGTTKGQEIYQAFLDASNQFYPDYVQELAGLADGAGLNFQSVMLINLQAEYSLLLQGKPDVSKFEHCSDIMIKLPSVTAMGHNEDGGPLVQQTAYLTQAHLNYNDSRQNFISYCYPGQLAGNAFSWDPESGMIWTVNSLFPVDVLVGGRPQYFMMRDALAGHSIAEVVHRLNVSQAATGFSMNVGSLREGRIVSIEVGPGDNQLTVYEVGSKNNNNSSSSGNSTYWYDHFNQYKHSPGVAQYPDPSSEHRAARVNQMGPPNSVGDILQMLGDTYDQQYPIYRNATPPDGGFTEASVLFDFKDHSVSLWTQNPKLFPPIARLSLV